ncbi:MAG: methyltransferase domain-containing protein [Anaerolineales bacterium]|jgi:ubiquinone/menaquinone biosynthesis C-methylase UbiE
MRLLSRFLRLFFHLLYHPFAWTYDLVSWTVSLGRWKDWVESVVPFIKGNRVLELGHGPGHLQRILHGLNLLAIGLDESRQMGLLAKRNLAQSGYAQISLIRGLGQDLPFPSETIDAVVATFPTEYIFEAQTLSEVQRILTDGGRFILLPVAWITGAGLLDKFAAWLFRITGQAPPNLNQEIINRFSEPFIEAGFQVQTEQLEVKSSLVLIVIAENRGLDV